MNVIITVFLSLWRNLSFFLLQAVLCVSDELQVQIRLYVDAELFCSVDWLKAFGCGTCCLY